MGSPGPSHLKVPARHPRPARFSEDALAVEFARRYANELRFTTSTGQWHIWNGHYWEEDSTCLVIERIRQICRAEGSACKDPHLKRRLASHRTINAVERLARTDPDIAVRADRWDRNPWLLNTPGGVVDLRTGRTCPGDRQDNLTMCTAVGPSGECPLWHSFLSKITDGDHELQLFLQRISGYALSGSTQEHALFFLYGTGANGKSVFLNTLSGLMGEYARTAPMGAFSATRNERHPTELAGLKGARLVTATETEEGRYWDEPKIKAITAGDPISARLMRQDFREYLPQFKVMIAGNHKPGLRNINEAMIRRLHFIPLLKTIPISQRDLRLFEKLHSEWPGILQWMINGCLAWQMEGLNPPQLVREATATYLESEDLVGQWLAECCNFEPAASSATGELFRNYSAWCQMRSQNPRSHRSFSLELEARGFALARSNRQRRLIGLRLVTHVTHGSN